MNSDIFIATLAYLYIYLRRRPLLIRQWESKKKLKEVHSAGYIILETCNKKATVQLYSQMAAGSNDLRSRSFLHCVSVLLQSESRCAQSLSLCSRPRLRRALPGMMQWIRSQRPGESGINIITADFVELGEFISAVITLNYHLDDDEDDAT